MIAAAYDLKKAFCRETPDWCAINAARAELARQSELYTSTEWHRIKVETIGREKSAEKRLPLWERTYCQTEQAFKQNEAVHKKVFDVE